VANLLYLPNKRNRYLLENSNQKKAIGVEITSLSATAFKTSATLIFQ
jgi:hypothetical protein